MDDQYTGAASDDDTILVSSSRAGRVYRVRGRRDDAVFADLDERLATSVCVTKGKAVRGRPRTFATAGQGAAIYAIAPGARKTAPTSRRSSTPGSRRATATSCCTRPGTSAPRVRVGPTEEPGGGR